MIDARFVPLERWPGERTPNHRRKNAQFRSTYAATLDLLEDELRHLGAKEIVIQAPFLLDQIRNDGWPKSSASPYDVAVVLSFETKSGVLAFPCDRFTSFADNVRAIALSLQALRAVDRYGVTRRAEQYSGWKQLPPPSDQPFANKTEAAAFLSAQVYGDPGKAARILTDREFREAAYRSAASRMHPDSPGGSHDLFVVLQAAKKRLDGDA